MSITGNPELRAWYNAVLSSSLRSRLNQNTDSIIFIRLVSFCTDYKNNEMKGNTGPVIQERSFFNGEMTVFFIRLRICIIQSEKEKQQTKEDSYDDLVLFFDDL